MVTIGGKTFDVIPLSEDAYPRWMAYVIGMAKDADHPVLRFIEKHLDGVPTAMQQPILEAWMKRPDWDDPSDELINEAASSVLATACLATLCLVPAPSWDEAVRLVTEDNKRQIQDAVNRAANPNDDTIRENNKALRDRLKARAEEAGPEAA